LGATINVVGDSFDDNGNSQRLDGFILGSVRAAYTLSEKLEAFGRIENAFDSDYQTASGFGTQGRAGYVGLRTNF
jgi:vitamin B12 transporter